MVSLAPYQRALASRGLRRALVLGLFVRSPVFASGVLITVHVVTTLGRTYAAAGLVAAAVTTAIAISGPWRGRLVDRHGMRRVVLPSVVITAVCWSIAPWVGYWQLLAIVLVAGLFVVPTFSVTRQAVIAAVPESDRRTAISLDSAALEVSFIIAPALAVLAATRWSTSWVLFVVQMLGVVAGIVLWIADPPLRGEGETTVRPSGIRLRSWFGPGFLAVCAAAASATVVLAGTDIAIVAAMREIDAEPSIGLMLGLWGLGSLVGGLLYGALHRSISAFWLLMALGAVTLPMAFADSLPTLGSAAFVAGLLCAPTITATVDQATRMVPVGVRGEAIGWHGSSLTAGGALGAPFAGVAIDRFGAGGGFAAVALLGMCVATVGLLAVHLRGSREPDVPRTSTRATLGT
ncbi:MAG: MFS transporter [Dermatophilaceae bacterium]